VVTEIKGEGKVQSVVTKNTKTDEEKEVETDGVFIYIGHDPCSEYVKGFVDMDDHGYVLTDAKLHTSQEGVFACGEIRQGAVRQLVSCCGEGCAAALEAIGYLNE